MNGSIVVASILLDEVSVEFAVYDMTARSLKNALIASTTGGRVVANAKEYVGVRALNDLSLQVDHGERIALVGHNGAGKSTVLRVLAGIYEPFKGHVVIEGKPVPLFDMSLGMDAESTGYENILLRGMFLGFNRREISERAGEIAEFAGLGSFLDIPVKAYSTGMAARLAFAISTAIEPDILLVDEGVGAGDAAFLEKANRRLEKMFERTRILVLASHNEDLLRRWCDRGLLLEKGQCVKTGSIDEVLDQYHENVARTTEPAVELAPSEVAALEA